MRLLFLEYFVKIKYNILKGNHMNKFIHLKILVFTQIIVLILMIIGLSYPLDSTLDPLLQEYLTNVEVQELNTSYLILIITLLLLLLINLVSMIALLFKKIWARKAYMWTTFIMLPAPFFLGTTVEHSIISGLNEILMFASGMLVTLLIYTNVYEEE